MNPILIDPVLYNSFNKQCSVFESDNQDNKFGSLVGSIVVVGLPFNPSVEISQVMDKIYSISDKVKNRVKSGNQDALLAHLNLELYGDEDVSPFLHLAPHDNYNDINANNLSVVAGGGIGFPSVLAVVYAVAAYNLGMKSFGIAIPGTFYVGIDYGKSTLYIDPSNGNERTANEIKQRFVESFPSVEWKADYVQPTSNKMWVTRILQNALRVYGAIGEFKNVAKILELEMILWPNHKTLVRDLALVLHRVGYHRQAYPLLCEYLDYIDKNHIAEPMRKEIDGLVEKELHRQKLG